MHDSSSDRVTIMGFASQKDENLLQLEGVDVLKNAVQHTFNKPVLNTGDFSFKMMVKEADFAESVLKAAKDLHVKLMFWGQTNGDNI